VTRLAGVVALAVLVAACGSSPVAAPLSSLARTTATTSGAVTTAEPEPPAGMARSEPVSVRVPRIGVNSSLIPLGLNADHTIQVPPVSTPMQAGWYTLAPTPGEVGPAIILGHVDGNKQPGVFIRLRELVPGDEVLVTQKDGGTARFVVHRIDQVPKDQFPTEAVYGDTDVPELRLIPCGGIFDRATHNYRDNIIVYAGPESSIGKVTSVNSE
jgi:hypothetical protein